MTIANTSRDEKCHRGRAGPSPLGPTVSGRAKKKRTCSYSVLLTGTTLVPHRIRSSREAVELIRRAQHGVESQCRKFMQPFRAPGEDLSTKTCTSRSAIAGKEQYRPSNSTETTTTAANGEAPRLPCPGARPRRRRYVRKCPAMRIPSCRHRSESQLPAPL